MDFRSNRSRRLFHHVPKIYFWWKLRSRVSTWFNSTKGKSIWFQNLICTAKNLGIPWIQNRTHSQNLMLWIVQCLVWHWMAIWYTRYTSKWPKTAVTEIGSCDFKMAQFQNGFSDVQIHVWGTNSFCSLRPFLSLRHFEVTWPYLCHSSFGPFWGISRNPVKWMVAHFLFQIWNR